MSSSHPQVNILTLLICEPYVSLFPSHLSCSWRSYSVICGCYVPVLGRFNRPSRFQQQRDSNSQPQDSSRCDRTLRILLFRTCCVPEHLHLDGKTEPVPPSPTNKVKKQTFSISKTNRIETGNLPDFLHDDFGFSVAVLVSARCYMSELLLWGI